MIPLPAVIHWTSPPPMTPLFPMLSSCSTNPSSMYVTVSMPRCGCHGNPASYSSGFSDRKSSRRRNGSRRGTSRFPNARRRWTPAPSIVSRAGRISVTLRTAESSVLMAVSRFGPYLNVGASGRWFISARRFRSRGRPARGPRGGATVPLPRSDRERGRHPSDVPRPVVRPRLRGHVAGAEGGPRAPARGAPRVAPSIRDSRGGSAGGGARAPRGPPRRVRGARRGRGRVPRHPGRAPRGLVGRSDSVPPRSERLPWNVRGGGPAPRAEVGGDDREDLESGLAGGVVRPLADRGRSQRCDLPGREARRVVHEPPRDRGGRDAWLPPRPRRVPAARLREGALERAHRASVREGEGTVLSRVRGQ